MLLLTWHATILRVEHAQNRLIHTPLVPARPTARDFVHVPESESRLVPAALHPNAVHLVNGETMLAAWPTAPFPHFETAAAGPQHTFLALPEADVAMLRALLSGPWRHAETGETIQADSIALHHGFTLDIGPHRLNLAEVRPTQGAGGMLHLPGGVTLLPLPKPRQAGEIALLTVAPPPATNDSAAFQASEAAAIDTAEDHLAFLPLTGSCAARDWFYRDGATPPRTGPLTSSSTLRHAHSAALLTGAHAAACIFSEAGLLHDTGAPLAILPPGVSREADTLYVAHRALAAAPVLEGPLLLATASQADRVATVAQLSLLARHAPQDARLLLPHLAEAAAAARETWLALAGLGERQTVLLPATQIIRVPDLYWIEAGAVDDLPPTALQDVRDRAHRALPATAPERIHVTEGLANAALARIAAGRQGFSVIAPAALSAAALAHHFRQAEFVVAPTGPVLDYLLFCAAGTRVIELAPEADWQPRTAALAGKLGLVHAVLPCKLEDGSPRPELASLAMLLRLMQARL